jgi:K+-sensing histidine kinase KdpD
MISTSRNSWWPSPAAVLAYAVAILSVTTALVTGLLLDQFLQTMPYVSLFLCSIMFAAWFGGFGPSLLATGIAILLFTYYFVDPGGSFEVAAKDIPRVALFAVTALFVVSLSAAQRRNADSLRFARDQLQATVGELARVNKALEAENVQRRRVEAYLDEAQGLSRTGSFSWKVSSGNVFWSKEGYRMLGLDQTVKPSIDLLLQRVHQDDHRIVRHEIDRARRGEQDCDYELRWLMPNRPTKHLRVRAHRVQFESGEDEIVGALIDVSEAREAQESLHAAQTALAHAARVATLGEMSASIAHEVNQPLAGIVTNGEAGLRWLDRKEPDLGEVRSAMERIIRDGKRASQVVERLRALARKAPAQTTLLDLNEVISEGVALVQREIQSHRWPRRVAAGRHQPDDERHAGDGGRNRPATASRGPLLRAGRRGACFGAGFGHRHRSRKHEPPVQRFLHDPGERHGHGLVDRPVAHRIVWRTHMGFQQRRRRDDFPVRPARQGTRRVMRDES